MPYVEDENGDHILDENGDKIEFTVEHFNDPNTYVYNKEEILVNDGHLDTEDRHFVIKYGVNDNHAVSKGQLNQAINALRTKLRNEFKQAGGNNR